MIISINLFLILATGFRGKEFKSFVIVVSHAPWQPRFLKDQISFSHLSRGSHKEHFCEVCLKLAKWYRICYLKQIRECRGSVVKCLS